MRPADSDTGIVFIRTDISDRPKINVSIDAVLEMPQRTALHEGPHTVETVEHCLAAVSAMGIDNILIELNAPELPNIDGSCKPYADALVQAGVVEQDAAGEVLVINEPMSVTDGQASLYALPCEDDGLSIMYELEYPEPSIGRQWFHFRQGYDDFVSQIAPARTFTTRDMAAKAREMGLFKHLSAADVLVFDDDGPVEGNTLRFEDECVRHKIADLLGDMALLGCPIRGRLLACRSGHGTNQALVRKLSRLRKRQAGQRAGGGSLLDIRKIQKILPHRYPFLLVDRVLEIDGDRRAVGLKNVTMNEPFFQGHFPGTPIMPGVLIVEAMAQMAGLLFAQRLEHTGQLAVLLTMDKVKMRRSVTPGDQLILDVEAVKLKSRMGDCRCRALVDGQVAAEADIRFMLVDADGESA